MNNKITSIAAALVAKAGTNASAGIGASTIEDNSLDNRKRILSCINNSNVSSNTNFECNKITGSCELKQHQANTNSKEIYFSSSRPQQFNKFDEPFYKESQLNREINKNEESRVAGTLRNDFYEHDSLKNLKNNDTFNDDKSNSCTLLSIIETNNHKNMFEMNNFHNNYNTLTKELPEVEYLTRKNFEDEFSSLIINSSIRSTNFLSNFQSSIKTKNKNEKPMNSDDVLTNKDLIEQIKLYNKYNNSKFTELNYELKEDLLLVSGLLKIHWNLKQPIQLSTVNEELGEINSSLKSEKYTNFKATLIPNFNRQSCLDDSSLNKKIDKALNESDGQSGRAHTVKCKPNKWKRPSLNKECNIDKENEFQNFIPAYASVSSIRIDNTTTCLEAIRILLEKYHILNSANNYSLYKCHQSGETREFNSDDVPLIERIWMGPFNEDKIFIMEKGQKLNSNEDVSKLVCLPESLLQSLFDNLNKEENKEIERIKERFLKYEQFLKKSLDKYEVKNPQIITTSCEM